MHSPNNSPIAPGSPILILGAGNYQIEAIEHLKSLGYRVLGCSYRNTDPGIPLLDGFRQIDVRDAKLVTQYARDEGARAVYSIGSDVAIPSIAQASEQLGLPHFISLETACNCQDKGKMRAMLAQTEWSLPFLVASSVDEAMRFDLFPAMMKPVDSQGQRGCFRVDSAEDVRERFDASAGHSSTGQVILERFVDGPEISANVFMRDGEVELLVPSDRYSYTEYPGGIIKEHGLPCQALSAAGRTSVEKLVREVTGIAGIADGPAYFQIKLDGDHPYVIEVTPRLDGCHMWRFVKHWCGYDLLAKTFELLLGLEQATPSTASPREGDWRLTFMSAQPGTTFDRGAYDVEGAEYLHWYYETGDRVLRSNGVMEKCGYRIHRVG